MNIGRADAPRAGKSRIMVVEDEVLVGMLLEEMLGDLGYEIAGMAARLDDALEMARQSTVNAAILDVNLNGGDVFPVADVLAEREIPFIFATGYGQRGIVERYRDRPVLAKPFQRGDLAKTLAEVIG